MTNTARHQILSRIRKGLGRQQLSAEQQQTLQHRLAQPQRNLLPERAKTSGEEALTMFMDMATEAVAEIIHIDSCADIPAQIKALKGDDERPLLIANEDQFKQLDWQAEGIQAVTRVAQKGDLISLTSCLAGVAETGTLVLKSGPDSPTTLNLLPDIHCVLLYKDQIIGGYEDAWDLVRQEKLPRTVNFITGPSRSADIEQKLQMGAHGPKRLVIFLL